MRSRNVGISDTYEHPTLKKLNGFAFNSCLYCLLYNTLRAQSSSVFLFFPLGVDILDYGRKLLFYFSLWFHFYLFIYRLSLFLVEICLLGLTLAHAAVCKSLFRDFFFGSFLLIFCPVVSLYTLVFKTNISVTFNDLNESLLQIRLTCYMYIHSNNGNIFDACMHV